FLVPTQANLSAKTAPYKLAVCAMLARPQVESRIRVLLPILLVFLFLLILPCGFVHAQSVASTEGAQLQASMPLGGDSILLEPAKQRLNMLATVECKDFEKIKIVG